MPTSEELVALVENGMLAGELARQFRLDDQAEVQAVMARCAALHNAGTLDLLRIIESGAMQTLNKSEFFMATQFFCQILPELDALPARMMDCVEALVTLGGGDLAANQPNAAFRTWCAKDPRRASEIIAAARDGDDLASRHLTFALEAINDITEARQIALTCDDARRFAAITALGRIVDNDPDSRVSTLAVFGELLDHDRDDNLRANLLQATVAILARDRETSSALSDTLVRRIVKDAGDLTVHQAAQALWASREGLQPGVVACLLEALAHLKPANKGTVERLDHGLQLLLETGHDAAAITYVTQLLSGPDDSLGLSDLDGFTRTLLSGPAERLSRVVVQWLQIGAPRLCDGLADALQSGSLSGPLLSLRAEDLAISPAAQVFICRKASGWCFLKPTTAASVLVSVLRVCDENTALEVQCLLVEPLLLNYGGIREYLVRLAPDDVAKGRVDQALARNEAYLAALKDVPDIKEMHPSERHRHIEWRQKSDQMRNAHKQAQTQSVFLSLIRHCVVLYGNRTLTFVKDGQDSLRPVETDLRSFKVSYEMPRMELVDPVSLDFTLRTFRAEKMAS
ncbi:MAG: hypothetical protein AB7V26_12955 [Lysobacterales bacterium]